MSKQYAPHEPEEEVLSVEDAFRDAERSEARWRAFEQKVPERKVVHSLEDIPEFASEEEERAWWATHDLAEELGTDVTEEHHALIRRSKPRRRVCPELRRRVAEELRGGDLTPSPTSSTIQCDDLFLATMEMREIGESHECQRMG